MQAIKDVEEGYQIETCVKCTNEFDTVSLNDWTITQLKKEEEPFIVDIKPIFSQELSPQSFQVFSQSDEFTVEFPDILDEHPGNVTIEVYGIDGILEGNTFTFSNIDRTMEGSHELQVALIDQSGQITNYTLTFDIEFV